VVNKIDLNGSKDTNDKVIPALENTDKKIFFYSLILPTLFVGLLWLVAIIESILEIKLNHLGVFPRTLKGLPGILLTPLIHSDFKHLFSNSVPLIVMGTGILYFYRSLSYRVFLIIWIVSGICLWIGGRPSYHIGASGIVYGLASFLFFSGIIRRDIRLAAISLVVVFLYGGMIWGVFPIWPSISWEGHLFGGIAGFACALAYRDQGPKRKLYNWEDEEEEEKMDMVEKPDYTTTIS
jgi:membrane associated rhomboid family serine protease